MAFVVEDGTGLASATAYASEAEFDAYWQDRNREDLADLDSEVKQAYLILGTDWVDLRHNFRGIKKNASETGEQALEWPREGVIDNRTGVVVDSDSVPVRVKYATIEAAALASTSDLLPNVTNATREIISETVGAGPIRRARTYASRLNSEALARKAYLYLRELLAANGLWRA